MICSNYDAFTLEEDGRIESQIVSEYRELNLSNPPTFIWANSSDEAGRILEADSEIDMIICMYNDRDKEVFSFAAQLRRDGSKIPFIMLIHYSKSVRQRIFENDRSGIDFVFSWLGNADLILAIVKLIEESIRNGWQGIFFDRIERQQAQNINPHTQKLIDIGNWGKQFEEPNQRRGFPDNHPGTDGSISDQQIYPG